MLKAVIEWLADFFDENPDEKMVVFAHHRQVQERLIAAFPNCARIYGYWEANPCLRVQQECSAHMISVSGAVGLARDRDDLVSSNSNAMASLSEAIAAHGVLESELRYATMRSAIQR